MLRNQSLRGKSGERKAVRESHVETSTGVSSQSGPHWRRDLASGGSPSVTGYPCDLLWGVVQIARQADGADEIAETGILTQGVPRGRHAQERQFPGAFFHGFV